MKELDHVTIHHVKLREHCDNGARSLKAAVHGLHRSRSHGCRGQASISIVLLDCSEGGAIQVPTLICPAFGVCGQRERQRGQILLREGKEKRRREKKTKTKKQKTNKGTQPGLFWLRRLQREQFTRPEGPTCTQHLANEGISCCVVAISSSSISSSSFEAFQV